MREPREAAQARGAPPGVGERLARETGLLAGRLARMLGEADGAASLTRQRALLEGLFDAVAEGRPLEAWEGGALERSRGLSHPLDRLVGALGLSACEVDLLLLAALAEQHEGLSAVLRSLHPRAEPRASVGLAAQLLCQSPEERLLLREVLETGAAVRSGALRLLGEAPFFERGLALAEALWSALHDLDAWPTGLVVSRGGVAVSGLEEWLARPGPARAVAALRAGVPRTVLVTADREDVAFQRAAALASLAGVPFALLGTVGPWTPELARLAGVHALARGSVPVLRVPAPEGPGGAELPSLEDFPGPVVLAVREGSASVHGTRPVLMVDVERTTATSRRDAWAALLPELGAQAPLLAARYSLEPSVVREVASDVRDVASLEARPPRLEDVTASVRARTSLSTSPGVKLLRPSARWEDLVLPEDRLAQLREAVDRLTLQPKVLDEWGVLAGRPGARGVRMLFTGPPGTGKTLSAEVLASALGVDLLLVDISRLVSKWIGETEKNLSEVFDTAEHAQAVLFFDEADGLFGRRSEVSDAHDRYANLETAYLLSRLERFEGLAVLSSNLRQNIDPAFIRRLEFVVEYDEPSHAERQRLWRHHLPSGVPLAPDVDLAELASLYPLTGGLIRNAAVAAAFLAAAQSRPITRSHLVRAVRREYEKSGRAFPGCPAGVDDP